MRAKVLLYRIGDESERDRALRDVLREMRLLTLDVTESQLGETVGRLVSTNAAAVPDTPPKTVPETEFMLLCSLGDRQLDRLLAAMRRAGAVVPHKAVLTEQNRNWALERLIEEVAREHELLNEK